MKKIRLKISLKVVFVAFGALLGEVGASNYASNTDLKRKGENNSSEMTAEPQERSPQSRMVTKHEKELCEEILSNETWENEKLFVKSVLEVNRKRSLQKQLDLNGLTPITDSLNEVYDGSFFGDTLPRETHDKISVFRGSYMGEQVYLVVCQKDMYESILFSGTDGTFLLTYSNADRVARLFLGSPSVVQAPPKIATPQYEETVNPRSKQELVPEQEPTILSKMPEIIHARLIVEDEIDKGLTTWISELQHENTYYESKPYGRSLKLSRGSMYYNTPYGSESKLLSDRVFQQDDDQKSSGEEETAYESSDEE